MVDLGFFDDDADADFESSVDDDVVDFEGGGSAFTRLRNPYNSIRVILNFCTSKATKQNR